MGMNVCGGGISTGGGRFLPFLPLRVDGPGCFARSSRMNMGVAISLGSSGRTRAEGEGEGEGEGEDSGDPAPSEDELARFTVLGGTIPVMAGGKALT